MAEQLRDKIAAVLGDEGWRSYHDQADILLDLLRSEALLIEDEEAAVERLARELMDMDADVGRYIPSKPYMEWAKRLLRAAVGEKP